MNKANGGKVQNLDLVAIKCMGINKNKAKKYLALVSGEYEVQPKDDGQMEFDFVREEGNQEEKA